MERYQHRDCQTVLSESQCFGLDAQGSNWELFSASEISVFIRGYVSHAPSGLVKPSSAAFVHRRYLESDTIPTAELQGSHSIIVMDAPRQRVLLYRNLVGNGFTYYAESRNGLTFASSLRELSEISDRSLAVNESVLPIYFCYRWVPGRETLLRRFHRLMPGELVEYDPRAGFSRLQTTSLSLPVSRPDAKDLSGQVEDRLHRVVDDCISAYPSISNLLSGGVDSSYLQAILGDVCERGQTQASYSVSVNHPRTRPDADYARDASRALGTHHRFVPADGPYIDYLIDTVRETGEPPNHVMSCYFGALGRDLRSAGVQAALCGEGADSLFGVTGGVALQRAQWLRKCLPAKLLLGLLANMAEGLRCRRISEYARLAEHIDDYSFTDHPANWCATFTDLPSVRDCFGKRAFEDAGEYRRGVVSQYRVRNTPLDQLHMVGFLNEAVDTASLWTTLLNGEGVDLLCPYLDSRLITLMMGVASENRFPSGNPKGILKDLLAKRMPREMVYRRKLGFGQPIFEWMAPGGQLRPWVENIQRYPFVPRKTFEACLQRPNWFLYSLLCYDVWHKLFIDRRIPRIDLGKRAILSAAAVGDH
ncbi:MAG: asparagine synthase [Gemmataceae bacterium]|nr:asparagine synthase [Gemmataceae bacterium]